MPQLDRFVGARPRRTAHWLRNSAAALTPRARSGRQWPTIPSRWSSGATACWPQEESWVAFPPPAARQQSFACSNWKDFARPPQRRNNNQCDSKSNDDRRPGDLPEIGCPDLLHDRFEFAIQNAEHRFYPRLSESCQAPTVGAPNSNGSCAERERLQNIGAASHAPIHENRNAAIHRLHDFRQSGDGGTQALLGAASVVGDYDPIDTVLHSQCSVVTRHDAFQDDLHFGCALQTLYEFPCHAGTVKIRHFGYVEAVEHGLARHLVFETALMTRLAGALVLAPRA